MSRHPCVAGCQARLTRRCRVASLPRHQRRLGLDHPGEALGQRHDRYVVESTPRQGCVGCRVPDVPRLGRPAFRPYRVAGQRCDYADDLSQRGPRSATDVGDTGPAGQGGRPHRRCHVADIGEVPGLPAIAEQREGIPAQCGAY